MKRSTYLLIFFFVVSFLHLTGISINADTLADVTKPLIVVSLLLYYFTSAARPSTVFMLGLLMSCVGDTLLIFQERSEVFFILGLASFLVAHLFYILGYRKHVDSQQLIGPVGTHRMRIAFPVLLAGSGLVIILLPHLDELKIPVMIYSLVLTLMVVSAIFRLGLTNRKSFWKVLIGALLFMGSDSLLAINKFMTPIVDASFWIMATYCAAQYFIVQGITDHTPET